MFAMFEGRAFQQIVGIPMGINCFISPTVPLLVQGRLYTGFSKENEKELVRFSNFTVRYIDDVLSLKQLAEFVDRIFPITADTARYASYIDSHLQIDSESQFRTKLYDKRGDLNFAYATQLIRY